MARARADHEPVGPDGIGPSPLPARNALPGYVVNRAARLFGRALNRRLSRVGPTVGQWPVLLALLEADGLTQAELSRRLDIEQPTTANTVKRMERDGLIRRAPHISDRRQEHLHLTQQARELAPTLAAIAAEVNGKALEGLTATEAKALMELLHRVIENLVADAESQEAPGGPAPLATNVKR